MTEPAPTPNNDEVHSPSLPQRPFIGRLRRFGLALLGSGLLLSGLGLVIKTKADNEVHHQLSQIALVESRITQELRAWNTPEASSVEPLALKGLLAFGKEVSEDSTHFKWFGSFHAQTLQTQLTQAIESLSRPVAGIDSNAQAQARQESQLRLDTLPKLTQLKNHIENGSNGFLILTWGTATLLMLAGIVMNLQWWNIQNTQALRQRINMLSRAVSTQQENDHRLEGAHQALEGLLAALNKKQHHEHGNTLALIGQQLEELKQSGRAVLDFAKSFHRLSTEGTQLAKTALHSEQRNQHAHAHIDSMQSELEGLRNDIRSAAQGLRKAGEISRQLLTHIHKEPSTDEPVQTEEQERELQALVEKSQQALKESIEGLVLASKRINNGQLESQKLAEFMAINQTAWSNLLDQVEQCTESASKESEEALRLAKRLIQSSNSKQTLPPVTNTPKSS
jgi:hypothetical protein